MPKNEKTPLTASGASLFASREFEDFYLNDIELDRFSRLSLIYF
jgi:hypothetical protein